MRRQLPLLLAAAVSGVVADDPRRELLERALHASLDPFASNHSVGAWVGVVTPGWRVAVASGFSDVVQLTKASPTDIIPAGSITKSWTAAYCMHLIDRGELQLDATLSGLVDSFLTRLNGTTLLRLWGGDKTIEEVTLGDVLHMKSGLNDYNDTVVRAIAMQRPGFDMPPQDYLHIVNKTFACPPKTCLVYSSVNFVLAGMVLAQHTNCSSWDELDQKAFLGPAGSPFRKKYAGVTFAGRGPCSRYENMVHSYASTGKVDPITGQNEYTDMYNSSCLNGWTMGNIAISAIDAAQFYYDLFAAPYGIGGASGGATGTGLVPSVVSGFSRWKMSQLERIGPADPWGQGIHYGYGTFDVMPGFSNEFTPPVTDNRDHDLIGHGGADYGTYLEGGWHPALNVAIAIGVNKDEVSGKDDIDHVFCLAYKAVFAVVGNITVTCPASSVGNTGASAGDRGDHAGGGRRTYAAGAAHTHHHTRRWRRLGRAGGRGH